MEKKKDVFCKVRMADQSELDAWKTAALPGNLSDYVRRAVQEKISGKAEAPTEGHDDGLVDLAIDCSEEQRIRWQEFADSRGLTIDEFVSMALRNAVASHKEEQPKEKVAKAPAPNERKPWKRDSNNQPYFPEPPVILNGKKCWYVMTAGGHKVTTTEPPPED